MRDVEKEYEYDKWLKVFEFVKKKIESGESNLTRILSSLQFEMRQTTDRTQFGSGEQKTDLSLAFALGGNQAQISSIIKGEKGFGSKHVYEFGSGFGRNLF